MSLTVSCAGAQRERRGVPVVPAVDWRLGVAVPADGRRARPQRAHPLHHALHRGELRRSYLHHLRLPVGPKCSSYCAVCYINELTLLVFCEGTGFSE